METVRDQGWKKVGSGIRDKHPGSATLVTVPGQVLEPDPEVLEPLLVLCEELVRLLADRVEGEHQALHLKQHSLHSSNYFLLNVRYYGDKLITRVNNTGNNVLPVTTTVAIIL
jgi:hypothetical protein